MTKRDIMPTRCFRNHTNYVYTYLRYYYWLTYRQYIFLLEFQISNKLNK